jgi:hypothetical protein
VSIQNGAGNRSKGVLDIVQYLWERVRALEEAQELGYFGDQIIINGAPQYFWLYCFENGIIKIESSTRQPVIIYLLGIFRERRLKHLCIRAVDWPVDKSEGKFYKLKRLLSKTKTLVCMKKGRGI